MPLISWANACFGEHEELQQLWSLDPQLREAMGKKLSCNSEWRAILEMVLYPPIQVFVLASVLYYQIAVGKAERRGSCASFEDCFCVHYE